MFSKSLSNVILSEKFLFSILFTSLVNSSFFVVFIDLFLFNNCSKYILLFTGNFITPLFNKLKKTKLLSKFVTKLENKANSKKDKIEKSEFIGLLLFVGIPLPGTGAWTGTLIASMINMNKKKALLAAFLGVILAGIIMMIVSYGLIGSLI